MSVHYAATTLVAFLTAAAFFAAAWGYGRTLLPRRYAPPTDAPLVEIALGCGALGYAAFALGLVGALRPGVLMLLLLVGVALLACSHARGRRLSEPVPTASADGSRWLAWGAAAAAAGALLFALLGAMLPEVEYDSVWYHLAFPRRYLERGALLDFACDHMSPTPLHTELLYSYGLLAGDARAAKLMHYGFGVLAAVWAGRMATRLAGARFAPVAAALFLTAPTVTWEMTTAHNELPLAFVATGAVALLLEWSRRDARHLLVLAGVLLGLGLAGKHLAAFVLAPLAVGAFLLRVRRAAPGARRRALDAALLCAVAVAIALPWYVRAWYYTGNPLFPLLYEELAALGVDIRRWDADAQRGWTNAMHRYGDGRTPVDLLLLPFRATWDSARYAGSVGPSWLLGLPVTVLAWPRLGRDARLIAGVVIAYQLLWMSPWSSFQIRYLVPVAPLVAVLLAVTLSEFSRMLHDAGWPALRHAVELPLALVLLLNLPLFNFAHDARSGWIDTAFHTTGRDAWRAALGALDQRDFLSRRLESYPAVQRLNEMVPPTGRVVWFGYAAQFYAVPELVTDYSRCVVSGTWGSPPGQEERAYGVLRAAGITHIAWDLTSKDFDSAAFAVRSPNFLRRYAERVYQDDVVVLDRLLPEPRFTR
jgi:hypothetical protein